MKLIELWTRAVFKRDFNLCQKCLSEGKREDAVDAHHIIHKDKGFLRYHLDNGVALCRQCHDLDAQGRLRGWCMEYIGKDKYWQMKIEGHRSLAGPKFEKDAVRKELKAYIER